MARSCLVWSPIQSTNEGHLELPLRIADAIEGPIFTHSCADTLLDEGIEDTEFIEFNNKSTIDKIVGKTPFGTLNRIFQYASWKPPAEYDSFVTRGPAAVHVTHRIGQTHIHYFEGSFRGPFLHKDVYDRFHSRSELSKTIRRPLRHYLRTTIQASVDTIDTVVVNSEWTRDVVESLYNCEVDKIIYPLMSLKLYSPDYTEPEKKEYYLYLGGIDAHHRTKEVIQAFNKLSYTLKVAGTGNKVGELKNIGTDNIEFIGYIEDEKKRRVLANAKALVNPTDHSFGRVLVESLASGTPVISISSGFSPYLINEGYNGLLYNEGIKNLVGAVERFQAEQVSATTEDLVDLTDKYKLHNNVKKWKSILSNSNSNMSVISDYH